MFESYVVEAWKTEYIYIYIVDVMPATRTLHGLLWDMWYVRSSTESFNSVNYYTYIYVFVHMKNPNAKKKTQNKLKRLNARRTLQNPQNSILEKDIIIFKWNLHGGCLMRKKIIPKSQLKLIIKLFDSLKCRRKRFSSSSFSNP